MSFQNVINMVAGLALFLFGMNIMGKTLEKRAGNNLRNTLDKMTSSRGLGFIAGMLITAIVQSSSATTVMVVGFVNSGLMTLRQSINVIMGANVGTTLTAWIISISGIGSSNIILQILNPKIFAPILGIIGAFLYLFSKKAKRSDIGLIMFGFFALMFGMNTMSSSVSGLKDVPEFQQVFLMFKNPFLGLLAGAILTAIIQASAASVGILQALATTGQVTFGASVPIIMGQNIGTCVTTIISSMGTSKNAKRAAAVHLIFNVIGSLIGLILFILLRDTVFANLIDTPATMLSIAVVHSVFNVFCTIILFPCDKILEKLVIKLVPDSKSEKDFEEKIKLEDRLVKIPILALKQSSEVTKEMGKQCITAIKEAISLVFNYDKKKAEEVLMMEEESDKYEDRLSSYFVKIGSTNMLTPEENNELSVLMRLINDFERIADHAENVVNHATEIYENKLEMSEEGKEEFENIFAATNEVLDYALKAFVNKDYEIAKYVEPLEEVIDHLREKYREKHIIRLQKENTNQKLAYICNELMTDIERVSDHCSNIAADMLIRKMKNEGIHDLVDIKLHENPNFLSYYKKFAEKYHL